MTDPTLELINTLEYEVAVAAVQLVNAARGVGVPLIVISGTRSVQRNRDVGGAARSLHLYGRAFDVQVAGLTREQVPTWWWESLGTYAEGLGLRWGGRFLARDVNHFDSGEFA